MPFETMAWIAAMIAKDEEEEAKRNLSYLEYIGAHANPEMAQRVRDAKNNTVAVSDEEFANILEGISGEPAPKFKKRD